MTCNITKTFCIKVDHYLNGKDHISGVYRTVSHYIALLRCIKMYLPLEARVQYYNANNTPINTDYFNTICESISDTKQVFMLQKRAVRLIIHERYRACTKDLFSILNSMPIHDRVNYRMVCAVHKALHNEMPEYISNMFDSKTRTTTTHTRECALKVPKHKLNVSHRGLAYKGPMLYNDLNINITNAPNIKLFRIKYIAEYFIVLREHSKVLNDFSSIIIYVR